MLSSISGQSLRRLLSGILILAATFSPLLIESDYLRIVAVMILINAIAATGVNVSMGYCGLVSVGHAGFLGIGAYVTAFMINYAASDALSAVASGGLAAGLAGIVIGLPTLRLNPLYIAMVTFGFGQAVNLVALNWIKVTGGPNGLAGQRPNTVRRRVDQHDALRRRGFDVSTQSLDRYLH